MFQIINKFNDQGTDDIKVFPELAKDNSTKFCSLTMEFNPEDLVRGNLEVEFENCEIEGMVDFCILDGLVSELEFEDGSVIKFD
jgi:hypothetical protein